MKRTYEKPEIMFESFALSTSISSGCEKTNSAPTVGSCPIIGTGDIAMFSDTIDGCVYTPGDMGAPDDSWDGFCYDVFNGGDNWFNST